MMTFDEHLTLVLEAKSERYPVWGQRQNQLTQPIRPQESPKLPSEIKELIRTELEEIRGALENLSQYPDLNQDISRALGILFPGSETSTTETMAGDPVELKIREFKKVIASIEKIKGLLGDEHANLRERLIDFRNHMRSTIGRKILRSPAGDTRVIPNTPLSQ